MLFITEYRVRPGTSYEDTKRNLAIFGAWTPPDGFEFKAHYFLADGSGGTAIIEIDSAAAMLEGLTPFNDVLEFKPIPAVDVAEGVGIMQKVIAWRDAL